MHKWYILIRDCFAHTSNEEWPDHGTLGSEKEKGKEEEEEKEERREETVDRS